MPKVVERPSYAGKINCLEDQHPDLYKEFHHHLDRGWDVGKLASWVKTFSGISLTEMEITMYDTERAKGRRHLKRVMAGEKREEIGDQGGPSSDGSRRGTIMGMLRDQVVKMMDAARKDRDSDANKIIEILLVDQMATEDVRLNDARQLLNEQRQRSKLEEQIEDLRKKRLLAEQNAKTKERSLKLREKQINAATKTVKAAQRALKEGRPFDQGEVFAKFSAALGLAGPPERRVEELSGQLP